MTIGGRTIGASPPTAPIKNIDTEAIRQEMHRKTYSDTFFTGVYAVGLFVSGMRGFYLAKTALDGDGTCLLSPGLMLIFIVGVCVTGKVVRRMIRGR